MRQTPALLAAVALMLLSGCAYNVGYNSTYLPAEQTHQKTPGKVLIYMPDTDANWVFKGHPTSFTGGGTTLTIPLGDITRQIAVRAFSNEFTSVTAADTIKNQADYTVVVQPRVQHFEYAYNQLKNLGFAITPETRVDLSVKVSDSEGRTIVNKVYQSGKIEGETYMASASPAEKVNAAVHKTLWKLMNAAIADIKAKLSAAPRASSGRHNMGARRAQS
ncbi:MAG: hypothetical protein P8076_04575 [Gammaproteobacteria bacterium]